MIVSAAVAFAGIAVAWLVWLKRWPGWADAAARRFGWFGRLAANRWWWDDLYNRLIVRGVIGVARWADSLDRALVDGAVNGLAWLTRETSEALRRTHTGRAQGYGLAMFFGVNALLLLYLFWG
jgi:NADH-quinone oxidoreductase subunit L